MVSGGDAALAGALAAVVLTRLKVLIEHTHVGSDQNSACKLKPVSRTPESACHPHISL